MANPDPYDPRTEEEKRLDAEMASSPEQGPGPDEPKAVDPGIVDAINDFFTPSPEEAAAMASRGSGQGAAVRASIDSGAIDPASAPRSVSEYNSRSGIGPEHMSSLAAAAKEEAAAAGERAGAEVYNAYTTPVGMDKDGYYINANGQRVGSAFSNQGQMPETPEEKAREAYIKANMPWIPKIAPGRRGRLIPAHEVQVGRTVGVQREGGPIPDDAMAAYMVAFADRQLGAEAKAAAAEAEAYIRRGAELGVAEAEQDGIRRQQRMAEQHNQLYNANKRKYESMEIDPKRVWSNKSTFSKIMAIISVTLGGFAAPSMGGRNVGLEMLNKEIDRDIAAQQQNRAAAKYSLDTLSEQFERERADVDLERAYRLKAVEMQVSQMIQGANIDQNQMEALKRELLAPIVKEYGDLLDRAAQRMAGKQMEEIQYKTQKAQYVGGGGGGVTLPSAVEGYRKLYNANLALGLTPKEADARTEAQLRAAGVSKRTTGLASAYARTGGGLALPPPDKDDGMVSPYSQAEQERRAKHYISTGPGRGFFLNYATPVLVAEEKKRAANYIQVKDLLQRLNRMRIGAGVFGTLPFSAKSAEATTLVGSSVLALGQLRTEAMSDGERKIYDSLIGDPSSFIDIQGETKINTMIDVVDRAQKNWEASLNGIPARDRMMVKPNGEQIWVVDLVGSSQGPAGLMRAPISEEGWKKK